MVNCCLLGKGAGKNKNGSGIEDGIKSMVFGGKFLLNKTNFEKSNTFLELRKQNKRVLLLPKLA